MLIDNITQLIGNTPLIEMENVERNKKLNVRLYAKYEAQNVTGSIKDRAALYMILGAEKKGFIKRNEGYTLITATSGNTGISLSFLGKALGYKVIIAMPESMSKERRAFMNSYGAELLLTPAAEGMSGSVSAAEKLAAETDKALLIDQFSDENNTLAHIETTGPEILRDLGNKPDYVIAGFGTGGTVSGLGQYFKSINKDIKIIAVEPASSPLVSHGTAGKHKIQGIGANFLPDLLDPSVIDEIVTVTDEDALKYYDYLCETEGLFSGISSGAALSAAVEIAKREEAKGKKIVVILPDSRDRYLS